MEVMNANTYEATWESLKTYSVPDWYQDGKFGIFIHWGVYSVPAFANEWYPRNMYRQGTPEFEHHKKTWGPHDTFGYKDFIPLFQAERFDPQEWVELFHQAGAKFFVPVGEHHDGFPLYDCSYSDWNSVKMGPRRDIVGELSAAAKEKGLVFGVSSHRIEHWWFMNGGRAFDSDVRDPRWADFYGPAAPSPVVEDFESEEWKSRDWQPRPHAKFLEDWLLRTCELVDKYQPQLVYFDAWIEQLVAEPYLQRFASHYYNRGREWDKGVVINYKHEAFPRGAAVFDVERGKLKGTQPFFWQADTSVSRNSWGYVSNQDYKSPVTLIHDLVDVVSKNGALLLNIGPRSDGSIPEQEKEILREIGRWLKVNGEAIYGTRPWKVFGEGPTEVVEGSFHEAQGEGFTARDVRFTKKGDFVYAIVLGWPANGEVVIRSLGTTEGRVTSVAALGLAAPRWSQDKDGLKVSVQGLEPAPTGFTLKIRL